MPTDDEREKRWLLRYFLGDTQLRREEEEDAEARVQADPSWQSLSAGAGETAEVPIDWDTPGELRKLRGRLGFASEDAERIGRAPRRRPVRRRRRMASFARVAAVLVLVVGAIVLVETLWAPSGPAREGAQAAMRAVATEAGQRASLRLADGTQVLLSVDSELRIPASMEEASPTRDVYLEGEAYFEVAPDATRPFRVHADGAVVQVLGTAFGVRAYPEAEERRVIVAEGHVAVRAAALRPAQEVATSDDVHLTRGQLGRWKRRHTETVEVVQHVDIDRYLAWREGRLVFDGTPLDEVARRLERWYALDVQLADAVPAGRSFTGSFAASTSADEALATVAFAFGLQYRKEGRTVVLRPPDH